jgi:hypothetical protein
VKFLRLNAYALIVFSATTLALTFAACAPAPVPATTPTPAVKPTTAVAPIEHKFGDVRCYTWASTISCVLVD